MNYTNEFLMLVYIFGVLFAIAVILLGILVKKDKEKNGDEGRV